MTWSFQNFQLQSFLYIIYCIVGQLTVVLRHLIEDGKNCAARRTSSSSSSSASSSSSSSSSSDLHVDLRPFGDFTPPIDPTDSPFGDFDSLALRILKLHFELEYLTIFNYQYCRPAFIGHINHKLPVTGPGMRVGGELITAEAYEWPLTDETCIVYPDLRAHWVYYNCHYDNCTL